MVFGMSAHCWLSRYEADGYATSTDWLVARIDAGRYADNWWETEEWRVKIERDLWAHPGWADAEATCLLPAGHAGPHAFTPDGEIVVLFRKDDGTWPSDAELGGR